MYEIEKENIKLELPDVDVFLKNLEDYIDKVNDKCLDIISEKLGITMEEAEELANKMFDEAYVDYMNNQSDMKLCTK